MSWCVSWTAFITFGLLAPKMMKSYLKYLILYKHCSQCLLGFMSVFSNAVSKFYDLKFLMIQETEEIDARILLKSIG